MCCLQKKHKGEKAGTTPKQKRPEQHVKIGRKKVEGSDREEEESTQQPARPKQRAKEDIQTSDSDLDDSSPTLNGYALNRTVIHPSDLWEWCTAFTYHVQSLTALLLTKRRLRG